MCGTRSLGFARGGEAVWELVAGWMGGRGGGRDGACGSVLGRVRHGRDGGWLVGGAAWKTERVCLAVGAVLACVDGSSVLSFPPFSPLVRWSWPRCGQRCSGWCFGGHLRHWVTARSSGPPYVEQAGDCWRRESDGERRVSMSASSRPHSTSPSRGLTYIYIFFHPGAALCPRATPALDPLSRPPPYAGARRAAALLCVALPLPHHHHRRRLPGHCAGQRGGAANAGARLWWSPRCGRPARRRLCVCRRRRGVRGRAPGGVCGGGAGGRGGGGGGGGRPALAPMHVQSPGLGGECASPGPVSPVLGKGLLR